MILFPELFNSRTFLKTCKPCSCASPQRFPFANIRIPWFFWLLFQILLNFFFFLFFFLFLYFLFLFTCWIIFQTSLYAFFCAARTRPELHLPCRLSSCSLLYLFAQNFTFLCFHRSTLASRTQNTSFWWIVWIDLRKLKSDLVIEADLFFKHLIK